MAKKDDDRASRPDDENPEWTAADFKKARPALTVFAETFGPEAAESHQEPRRAAGEGGQKGEPDTTTRPRCAGILQTIG
jgi:hypothetical protein